MWTGFIWLRIGPNGRLFKYDIKAAGSMKGREFLDQPSDYKLLKVSAVWS